MINRRENNRVPLFGTATVKFEDKGTIRSIHTLPASISLGGMGLYTADGIDIGTDILITINFVSAYGEPKTDSIEGCVIYDDQIEDIHLLGIRFKEDINSQNGPLLYEHMQKILEWAK